MPDELITKTECELRCGAYKAELAEVKREQTILDTKCIEITRWQAEHDGRINAWWEQQFRQNKSYDLRLAAVERKVIWASGFSAGAGAILGVIIGGLLTRLMGG